MKLIVITYENNNYSLGSIIYYSASVVYIHHEHYVHVHLPLFFLRDMCSLICL